VLGAHVEGGYPGVQDAPQVPVDFDLVEPEVRARLMLEVDPHPDSAPDADREAARARRR